MSKNRTELKISVPNDLLNDMNSTEWDIESFNLVDHLCELSKYYSIRVLKEELRECELILKKQING